MRIVELILDEDQEIGIEAISVVENPAIEEDFIALKSQEFKLAEVDKLYIENKSIYIDFLILLGTFVKFPKNYLMKLVT